MNNISLPNLKSIHLKDFSLYPNCGGLDFHYDFVKGVNMIVGGNGMGKTTLINLIKYGLIGNYKEARTVRIFKDEEKFNRVQLNDKYFAKRMDQTYERNNFATLTIQFYLGKTLFIVKRGLEKIQIEEVQVKYPKEECKNLEGEIVTQRTYQNSKDRRGYLQYNFEQEVIKASGLSSFDSLIFLVNDILFFGEDRGLVFWNNDVQKELSSKFFIDPKLDKERTAFLLKKRAHDTKARQTSEKIRTIVDAIKSVEDIDNIDSEENQTQNKNYYSELNEVRKKIDSHENAIRKIQDERVGLEEEYKTLNASRIKTHKSIGEIDLLISKEEEKIYENLWQELNPKYDIYVAQLKTNSKCPICNQGVQNSLIKKLSTDECFYCEQPIKIKNESSEDLIKLKQESELLLNKRRNFEKNQNIIEDELKKLDARFRRKSQELFGLKSEKRKLEFALEAKNENTELSENASNEPDDYFKEGLLAQIRKLEEEKERQYDLSKQFAKEVRSIEKKIEEAQVEAISELSKIFNSYAGKFLGMKCDLTYDSNNSSREKYFIPKIDGYPRLSEEEFSESQRFFVDLSFRLSILRFFYTDPAFFLCETPDSSLDISYENNAAEVFLEFLKKPNTLVISSNFNNSEFLDHIIEKSEKIGVINLLKIGKQSIIQSDNKKLEILSTKIEKKINEKSTESK